MEYVLYLVLLFPNKEISSVMAKHATYEDCIKEKHTMEHYSRYSKSPHYERYFICKATKKAGIPAFVGNPTEGAGTARSQQDRGKVAARKTARKRKR